MKFKLYHSRSDVQSEHNESENHEWNECGVDEGHQEKRQ